jgi:hypothetical protein
MNGMNRRQQQHMEIVARQNISNLEPMIHSEKKEDVITKGMFASPHQNPNLSGNKEGEKERNVKNGKVEKGEKEHLEGFSCIHRDLSLFTAIKNKKNMYTN